MATIISITIRLPSRSSVVNPVTRGVVMRTLPRIGLTVLNIVHRSFVVKSQGHTDTAGLRWVPLSEARLAHKRRVGRDHGILRYTQALVESLEPASARTKVALPPASKPGQVFRVRPPVVSVGTSIPYARSHQTGTAHKPQRRLWASPRRWPRSWWTTLARAIGKEIANIIKARHP